MKYLIINTAGKYIEILAVSGACERFYTGKEKERASSGLLIEIERMLSELNISLSGLDYIGCVTGPGSFTGIRIGMATVKAFCQALGKRAVEVNQFELLAYNNKMGTDCCALVVDGNNGVSYISVRGNGIIFLEPKCILNEHLKPFLEEIDEPYALFSDYDISFCGQPFTLIESNREALKAIMEKKIQNGSTISYDQMSPLYIRRSQAEREKGEI